jgi:hypothetical protein
VSLNKTLFWNLSMEDMSSLQALTSMSKSYTFSPYSSSSMNVFGFILKDWFDCVALGFVGAGGAPTLCKSRGFLASVGAVGGLLAKFAFGGFVALTLVGCGSGAC